MTERKPTGTAVRQWIMANGHVPFTYATVVDALKGEPGLVVEHDQGVPVLKPFRDRVRVCLRSMVQSGHLSAIDMVDNPAGKGRMLIQYQLPDKAVGEHAPSAPETTTPPPTPAESVSEHDMGRAIYDYISRLKELIAKMRDGQRRLDQQSRLRDAEHNRQMRDKTQRICALEQQVAELRTQLSEAKTVIVRRPARTLAAAELFNRTNSGA